MKERKRKKKTSPTPLSLWLVPSLAFHVQVFPIVVSIKDSYLSFYFVVGPMRFDCTHTDTTHISLQDLLPPCAELPPFFLYSVLMSVEFGAEPNSCRTSFASFPAGCIMQPFASLLPRQAVWSIEKKKLVVERANGQKTIISSSFDRNLFDKHWIAP